MTSTSHSLYLSVNSCSFRIRTFLNLAPERPIRIRPTSWLTSFLNNEGETLLKLMLSLFVFLYWKLMQLLEKRLGEKKAKTLARVMWFLALIKKGVIILISYRIIIKYAGIFILPLIIILYFALLRVVYVSIVIRFGKELTPFYLVIWVIIIHICFFIILNFFLCM